MYYIMTVVSGSSTGSAATYKYLTEIEAGTGNQVKKSFATLADAQAYVQNEMVGSGVYSLSSFIVVKGVTITAAITLAEETV